MASDESVIRLNHGPQPGVVVKTRDEQADNDLYKDTNTGTLMQAGETDNEPTVATLLKTSAEQLKGSSRSARLDAEVLLAHALGWQRSRLFGDSDERVRPEIVQRFVELIEARQTGQPVAQLVGTREFWSLELTVSSDTLVPRPETEMLVELALKHLVPGEGGRVLDLGTGSGAVALALASERPELEIIATDLSEEALKVARYNAGTLKVENVEFRFGDWFRPVADEYFDVIVSNPPYVTDQEWMLNQFDLSHEPDMALRGGRDGLLAIEQIVEAAPGHLVPGGWLLIEHGFRQGPAAMRLFQEAGLSSLSTYRDLPGRPRVTEGRWPENDD
jgi:release factor glutamine methyltransferase